MQRRGSGACGKLFVMERALQAGKSVPAGACATFFVIRTSLRNVESVVFGVESMLCSGLAGRGVDFAQDTSAAGRLGEHAEKHFRAPIAAPVPGKQHRATAPLSGAESGVLQALLQAEVPVAGGSDSHHARPAARGEAGRSGDRGARSAAAGRCAFRLLTYSLNFSAPAFSIAAPTF